MLQCNLLYCMITEERPDGEGAMMRIICLIGMAGKQARADKSAVGAINRPLHGGKSTLRGGWTSLLKVMIVPCKFLILGRDYT